MAKVKRYNGEDGSDVDMSEIRDEEGTLSKMRRNTETGEVYDPEGSSTIKPAPVAASKPAASKPAMSKNSGVTRMSKEAGEAARAKFRESSTPAKPDVTKMSVAERSKLSRESARSGSGKTDTRSVNERVRSLFGMKKGGPVKKMASGGSASSRADGIAVKGKTRGKMC